MNKRNTEKNYFQKGKEYTIHVNWHDKPFLVPLDGAKIIIENLDTTPSTVKEGILTNGKYLYPCESDITNYQITIKGEYVYNKTKLSLLVPEPVGTMKLWRILEYKTDNKLEINNNKLEINLVDYAKYNEAIYWSAFQALTLLMKIAESQLVIIENDLKVFIGEDKTAFLGVVEGTTFDSLHLERHIFNTWDVIAHEFGHYIARKLGILGERVGGMHDGINQYDYNGNDKTENNKKNAITFSFSEGYATWIGIYLTTLLKDSSIFVDKNIQIMKKLLGIDDIVFDDGSNSVNLESNESIINSKSLNKVVKVYGEDSEMAIAKLLWDLLDEEKDVYDIGQSDTISYPLKILFDKVFKGKGLANISDFYREIFKLHVDNKEATYLDDLKNLEELSELKDEEKFDEINEYHNVTAKDLNKTLDKISELGVIFGWFGMAPKMMFIANAKATNKLIWGHRQTGSIEPPRDCRRLNNLRELPHENSQTIFQRNPTTSRSFSA